MDRPLRILFVTAELTPLVKTGGLGDVANSLPRALHALGHDVRVLLPCYGQIPYDSRGTRRTECVAPFLHERIPGALRESAVPGAPIPLYLIEHAGFFERPGAYGENGREYPDTLKRFCFFALAGLDGVSRLDWKPDVVHCHDWHTGSIPALLRTRLARDPYWGNTPSVFTIHNLGYQGRYSPELLYDTGLDPALYNPDFLEFYGDLNLMKAALVSATKLSTVSRRYAKEIQTPEYGHGLDGVLRVRSADLTGILNGVDYTEWNPETDPLIAARYSTQDLSGKDICKRALQAELGLAPLNAPVIGIVSRMDTQKGLDLVADAMDTMMRHDIQLVALGTGDPRIESRFMEMSAQYPERLRFVKAFDVGLAHRIQAASDFVMMPSHYEPSGLSQLYAMAYGALPIVRKTGGLADSVTDASKANLARGTATGFFFGPATAEALIRAFHRALRIYRSPEIFRAMRVQAMRQRFSWEKAAAAYVRLFTRAIKGDPWAPN